MTRPERELEITYWLLDTRSLWPGQKIAAQAAAELQLISPEERQACTRKYHIADARMSLASALLKRLFVSKTLGIPWTQVRYGRKRDPTHGKPCALLPDGSQAPIEFNVSHQNGLVALVGSSSPEAELGVDIVHTNERLQSTYKLIDREGLDGWVDIYEDIFSDEECWDMKYNVDPFPLLDGTVVTAEMLGRHDRVCRRGQPIFATLPSGEKRSFSSDLLIDAKLRKFYVYWCFKEAYIKLDGEALLAKWIKELEFKNVRAPRPGTPARCATYGSWGERVSDSEAWLKRRRLTDVRLEIQSFEEDFMIGVAAKPADRLPEYLTDFKSLHLEHDIVEFATPF
ncbi:4'-phosphopantetheinyl transferase [Karstenula rhodostoma CBS 690.94]|uniref:holo-[acyl-carrier-protein] synthase n=1 Tax=Karstenula rhodostoma CBS 690.94 TaxID=1392251 RepID=A0A9P4P8M3_9PLEO|nr:4'-phosphopantetheinyl transferase [Karstenula rhodostoma CBS 690.94]